ncbi:chemotaxis protein CheD [Azospirillum fermentarium]|uniref:chemotaxis protein n=1 Tax=Azospirillum fermentarium TaxID=1233114 RepID=UPI0022278028|nr:chemotaxis protein [Azospirillum fermentarium]MCW2245481.1 chemotaxis protein CheD [Azospirillum fermentarium]
MTGIGSRRLGDRAAGTGPKAGGRKAGGYFNPQFQAHTLKVFLGHHQVSDRPDVMMVTTLGSCVAACIWDPAAAVGGMNHFLLPEVPDSETGGADAAARYGSVAMEWLINDILSRGGKRNRLEAKVFGGARVIDSSFDVGRRNGAFVLDYLQREGLSVTGQDLGGTSARRVHFFPHTGRAMRKLLRAEALNETVTQEMQFRSTLRQRPIEGDVELFGD